MTPPLYASEPRWNRRLKPRNRPPNTLSIPRVSASLGSLWPLSSSADRAGDSVSELIAEITVEIAMVTANCL
ncbi:hypothetical protein D3C71_1263410 [compost metagenome]